MVTVAFGSLNSLNQHWAVALIFSVTYRRKVGGELSELDIAKGA